MWVTGHNLRGDKLTVNMDVVAGLFDASLSNFAVEGPTQVDVTNISFPGGSYDVVFAGHHADRIREAMFGSAVIQHLDLTDPGQRTAGEALLEDYEQQRNEALKRVKLLEDAARAVQDLDEWKHIRREAEGPHHSIDAAITKLYDLVNKEA